MRRIALAVWVQAAVLLAAPSAHATFPFPPPPPGTAPQAYPDYPRLPTTTPPGRPIDFPGSTEWKLTSDPTGDPAIDSSPPELFGVRGMGVDRAWQVTTGRAARLSGGLGSGIRWDDVGAMRDLARKVHINRGELPLPRDAAGHTKPESSAGGAFLNPDPYDLNDDGVFD